MILSTYAADIHILGIILNMQYLENFCVVKCNDAIDLMIIIMYMNIIVMTVFLMLISLHTFYRLKNCIRKRMLPSELIHLTKRRIARTQASQNAGISASSHWRRGRTGSSRRRSPSSRGRRRRLKLRLPNFNKCLIQIFCFNCIKVGVGKINHMLVALGSALSDALLALYRYK